jgi:alpha-N-arabinofuranosidase
VRYATMLRHVDPGAELVACGFDDTWNAELLSTIGKHQGLVDHLSIHHYWTHGGPEIEFSEAEYYTLLAEAGEAEEFVKRTAAIIRDATGGKHPIGIGLDEWGVWHPEARPWGPGEVSRREPVTYEQAGTLRDALAAAVALEGFHRQCQVLTLANLAQVVNVLHAPVMTDGARMWLTPTYHALRMHTPHIGATALPVDIAHGDNLPDGSIAVSATASRTDDGVAVTLINRHYQNPASVCLVCADSPERATGQLLAAESPRAHNDAGMPDRVAPTALAVQRDGRDSWLAELPPHSIATVVFRRD